MGLDLAAANSGLCVIEAHASYKHKILAEEAFYHKTDDFRNRIDAANEILKRAKQYNPDLIVIEDYAKRMGLTNTSAYEHAEMGGMTKKILYEAGYLMYIIPPTTMRSFVNAPPKSPKEFLEEQAEKRLGFVSTASSKKKRSNITDAFWHAHIGALTYFVKQGNLDYELMPYEERMLYGDKKIVGLKDRERVEYGKES